MSHNDTNLLVDDNDFFWLVQPDVWSDIIGYDAAFNNIKKGKGNPYSGFYEANEAFILTFFHPNSFDLNLARSLFAPNSSLHPSLWEQGQTSSFATGFNCTQLNAKITSKAPASTTLKHCFLLDDSDEESDK